MVIPPLPPNPRLPDAHSDISGKAVSLGRIVDRLETGRYAIEIDKGADGTWTVRVSAIDEVRIYTLPRKGV